MQACWLYTQVVTIIRRMYEWFNSWGNYWISYWILIRSNGMIAINSIDIVGFIFGFYFGLILGTALGLSSQ